MKEKKNIDFQINPIGYITKNANESLITLNGEYLPGLSGIQGFSHLLVVWWGHLSDSPEERKRLVLDKLFKRGPEQIGTFATRSPFRPNPILISTIKVDHINLDQGIIHTPFIDAEDETPVLDIKPYFPMERVKTCQSPEWCQHWPQWYEDSITYNWGNEIVMHDESQN